MNVARPLRHPAAAFRTWAHQVWIWGPPAALPPADSTGLSHTSPKVPAKNACPGGLPRLRLHRLTGGDSGPRLRERGEERAEPRLRRDAQAQACEAQDHHLQTEESANAARWTAWLVPVGAPLCPACVHSVALPKEDKAVGADLKPAAGLSEVQADLQRPRVFSSRTSGVGDQAPGHPFSPMSEVLQEVRECHCETVCKFEHHKLMRCFQ